MLINIIFQLIDDIWRSFKMRHLMWHRVPHLETQFGFLASVRCGICPMWNRKVPTPCAFDSVGVQHECRWNFAAKSHKIQMNWNWFQLDWNWTSRKRKKSCFFWAYSFFKFASNSVQICALSLLRRALFSV